MAPRNAPEYRYVINTTALIREATTLVTFIGLFVSFDFSDKKKIITCVNADSFYNASIAFIALDSASLVIYVGHFIFQRVLSATKISQRYRKGWRDHLIDIFDDVFTDLPICIMSGFYYGCSKDYFSLVIVSITGIKIVKHLAQFSVWLFASDCNPEVLELYDPA